MKFYKKPDFSPKPLSVDELGWQMFLRQWNDEAMKLVKQFFLIGKGISCYGSEEKIRKIERELNIRLPSKVFTGGFELDEINNRSQSQAFQEILDNIAQIITQLDEQSLYPGIISYEEQVLKAGELRNLGASLEKIQEIQHKLGVTLPPSYANFLQASNGWKTTSNLLLPVEEIDWLKVKEPEVIEMWLDIEPPYQIPDSEYDVYDNKQEPAYLRTEYLEECLLISSYVTEETSWFLLNPKIKFDNGEWESWNLDTKGGVYRYKSFKEMMEDIYTHDIEVSQIYP